MTCNDALEMLLAADAAELDRTADSPLVHHLGGCRRCRAVAERLLADTAQLAVAVRTDAARSARPHRGRNGLLVLGAVATAVLVVLSRREPAGPVVPIAPPVVETAAVPAPVATPTPPPATVASRNPVAPTPPVGGSQAFARATERGDRAPVPVVPAAITATRATPATAIAARPARQLAVASRARPQPAVPAARGATSGGAIGRSDDVNRTVRPDAETGITVIWLN